MIGYVCKYTPIEIIEAFGDKPLKIEPSVSSFDKADTLMHPNMCCYSKAVLEHILENNIDAVVLTTSCDSVKRLYDVLKSQPQIKFVYIIDVPRKINFLSVTLFKNELLKFICAYENYSNKKFDINVFKENIESKNSTYISDNAYNSNNINLCLMGARCSKPIIDIIENSGGTVTNNLTCTGQIRTFAIENEDILLSYSKNILNFCPCMRMTEVDKKYSLLQDIKKNCDGIIYHTVKFCDSYSYDYAKLKNITNLPMLKIETDYTAQCEGQIKTRIEAFIESLKSQNTNFHNKATNQVALDSTQHIVMGIDSGSTSTNVVIINENKKILSYSIVRTGAKSKDSAKKAVIEALNNGNIERQQLSLIVSTGYGRVNLPFADMNITEISCHGKGAHHINNKIRTIIDIGGQDSKVIRLNEKGEVTDFVMNDKCAAGTGRFLEMMAKTLEIPIEDMGTESLKWKKDISITNMCTVFAESEVISLIAENIDTADIIHGLNNSISRKVTSLLGRVGKLEEYMMSGGVAKNIGVVKAIEEKLQSKIFIPQEPEIVGALGAALIGLESLKNKE